MTKKIRFYWWLLSAFVKKNIKFIITSFVFGFIVIFFFLSVYPSISALLFRKKEVVGIVGRVKIQLLPKSITSLISSPLVTITPAGEIIPVLVNSWEIMPDKKTFRFHIKNGLTWSDDKDFTAHDIRLDFAEGVQTKVIDDLTIEFKLDQPLEVFPVYLTQPLLRHNTHGVGGLYKVRGITFKKGYVSSLNLFPNKSDLPHKTFRFYPSIDEQVTAYKTGEIKQFETTDRNTVDAFAQWKNTEIVRSVDYNRIMTLFFNTKSELFKERDARKAVAYAIKSFSDYGVPAIGPIPPTSWAHYSNIKQYSYNIDKAKESASKIIDATESANMKLYTFIDYAPIAESIKEELDKVNFKVSLKLLSYIPEEFDIFLTIWDVPQDPDQYFFWHSKQTKTNLTNYNNVKIDKLLESGREVVNVQQRKKIYRDFQKLIVDDLPAHFMYYPYVYTIKRK